MKKKLKKKRSHSLVHTYIIALFVGFFLVLLCGGVIFIVKHPQLCANSISCIKDLSGKYEPGQTEGVFMGRRISIPEYIAQLPQENPATTVLGSTTGHKKHIYVDLTNQMLFAAQDGQIIYEFPISSGKWHPTPTGDFTIWDKLIATRMAGGEGADAYDLPNVPFTQFFYNADVGQSQGFSIHGAYWHNNFGHPMSHGCVNMRIEDAKTMFYWADPSPIGYATRIYDPSQSTPITIYGEAPYN